ncbi:hypothetical protein BIY24_03810 [Halobacteriovorax marinus]|uniref:protein NO VEIN domain-containing protein n=1 Tax=Halobacteriovorax marinus TaxID=97084 RepID=UPI000BC340C5|nr:DUF3883 domain-containing protein [Halobacteriovorax marinus]ATH07092.1 hypothetical protein BIY24_03810 [Halobacteriovorax marinus]
MEKDGECLYLEVKGHLGDVIQFELAPNEYDKMKEFHLEYRVCVVCEALTTPSLDILDVTKAENGWHLISQDRRRTIKLFEKVAAKAAEITKNS